MRWIDALERRFGDWAIPQFPLFIVFATAGIYVLALSRPEFVDRLSLWPDAVMSGEVWRVFTFLFVPIVKSPLWFVLWLFVIFQFAQALENAWGGFRFCFFYFFGALATVLASLITQEPLSNASLYTTLFLAFATLYPDMEVLLFFILPVKVRYLAWVSWGLVVIYFAIGGFRMRVEIVASLANYLLFFGPEIWRGLVLRWEVHKNRRRFRP